MSDLRQWHLTALITGGSKGIGLALAREFARHGHDLVLVGREQVALDRAATSLRHRYAVTVSTRAVDLSRHNAPAELFHWAEEAGIQIDVLVNNAGLGDHGAFAESDLDRQMAMLNLNMLSLTAMTHWFLKPMIARGQGRILNVASVMAYFAGGPQWASYVASKAYVLSFSRGLATELHGTGVSVTALSPGTTATDFVGNANVGNTRAYRWLPKVSVNHVARAGYRATVRGRQTVVPGIFNKVLAFLGELHPRIIAQGVFTFLSHENPKLRN